MKNMIVVCALVLLLLFCVSCSNEKVNNNLTANNNTAANTNSVVSNPAAVNTNTQNNNATAPNNPAPVAPAAPSSVTNNNSAPAVQTSNPAPVNNTPAQNSPVQKVIPDGANLSLMSTPDDSQVYIDNQLVGTTPIKISVEKGARTIEVKKYGYADYKLFTFFDENSSTSLSVVLNKEVSFVSVSSSPSFAMVYFNGMYKGYSPAFFNESYGQIANVSIKLDGYVTYSEIINVSEPGQTYFVNATLTVKH